MRFTSCPGHWASNISAPCGYSPELPWCFKDFVKHNPLPLAVTCTHLYPSVKKSNYSKASRSRARVS